MNQLLEYEGREVRMITQNGEPWWVVKDVCEALAIANSRDAITKLDVDDVGQTDIIDGIGRKQKTSIVNEAGLYALILRSDKPEAKKFKRWITHEVLPSIRKTGAYMISQQSPQDEFAIMRGMIDVLEANKRRISALEGNVIVIDSRVATVDSDVRRLESRVDLFGADTHYRTVRAYCNQNKIKVSQGKANAIGRKAAALCRERNVDIGDVPDERHGTVHSYPIEILDEATQAAVSK